MRNRAGQVKTEIDARAAIDAHILKMEEMLVPQMDNETGTVSYPSLKKIGTKGSEMMSMFEMLAKKEVAKLNQKNLDKDKIDCP